MMLALIGQILPGCLSLGTNIPGGFVLDVPVLEARCVSCHGPEKQKGGLRLDSRAALLKGGDSGPAAVPGDPAKSLLIQAVSGAHAELKRMPPKEILPADQVEALARWIKDGLVWPEAAVVTGPLGDAWTDRRNPIVRIFGGQRLDLWSLRPVRRVPLDIDGSLRAELRKKGLDFSPEADRRALIRRVTFDLIGLPPTPEEIEAFAGDGDFEKVVDRLLADPRHGERWARHWLDVVRYSDTNGFERDEFQPLHWRYRDYVIRSLNADKPFDLFLREQLAGDERVPGAPKSAEEVDALLATGYLRMGPFDSTGVIFMEDAKNRNELLTDLANTTGSAFLGMSMACANCHDHKHDPISQADHFRLRAFFAGVKRRDDTRIDLGQAKLDAEIDAIKERLRAALRAGFPEEIDFLLDQSKDDALKPWRKKLEAVDSEELAEKRKERIFAMTAGESGKRPPTHVFYQGDFTQAREEVAPGFLSVLDPNPAKDGRRSTLADAIVASPLAARVIVNRLWHHHFGRGIVATPNDFGFGGARPSHPELLDALAAELVDGGWRLKRIHRLIVLSRAYRQASAWRKTSDEENLLLWRQNPRRLDAEATRDALLFVAGALKARNGGPPAWPAVPKDLLDAQPGILETKSDKAAQDRLQAWYTTEEVDVRSIYLIQKRCLPLPFLQPLDTPDTNVSCGRRDVTIVAPQALQLLNSAFAERMARALAQAPLADAFARAVGRPPSAKELKILESLPTRVDACRAILNLNEFVYVD
ncbi:MAG TPA: PSD1 and planctomycete cytochrome C domain-containing protein [Planctomycetota bacterium]